MKLAVQLQVSFAEVHPPFGHWYRHNFFTLPGEGRKRACEFARRGVVEQSAQIERYLPQIPSPR
jgi:hypothetical protein